MPGPGPNAPLRLPPKCTRCQINRVAWTSPRVDFCYGACPADRSRLHPASDAGTGPITSAKACAVAVIPAALNTSTPARAVSPGACTPVTTGPAGPADGGRATTRRGRASHCGRVTHVSDTRACRLCLENARFNQEPGRAPDVAASNRDSQQLFFANMAFKRRASELPAYVTLGRPLVAEEQESAAPPAGHTLRPGRTRAAHAVRHGPRPRGPATARPGRGQRTHPVLRVHPRRPRPPLRLERQATQCRDPDPADAAAPCGLLPPRRSAPVTSWRCALRRHDHLDHRRPRRSRAPDRGRPDPGRAVLRCQVHRIRSPARTRCGSTSSCGFRSCSAGPGTHRASSPRTRDRRDPHPRSSASRAGMGRRRPPVVRRGHPERNPDRPRGLPKNTSHRHFAENGLKSLFKILKGRRLVFTNPMRAST